MVDSFSFKRCRKGRWVKSPGSELFTSVKQKLGHRPMIAEDLGRVTPADISLRIISACCRCVFFSLALGTKRIRQIICRIITYRSLPPIPAIMTITPSRAGSVIFLRLKSRMVMDYTGGQSSNFNWDSLRTLQSSAANLVIFPLQDILGWVPDHV